MSHIKAFILSALFCLLTLNLYSQRREAFLYKDLSEVIANEVIKSIAKDPLGHIWFATDHGLLRYDGIETRLFDRGLQSNYTKDFLVTTDGKLLVLNDEGVMEVRSKGDSVFFMPLEINGHIFNGRLRYPKAIYQDQRGNIWIGEYNAVVRLNSGGLRRYEMGSDYQSISYHRSFSFAEDAFGHLWIAPYKGSLLTYYQDTEEVLPVDIPLGISNVTGICVVRGDFLLVGGTEGLVELKVDSDRNILASRKHGSVHNISALAAVEDDIYLGTWDKGLYRMYFESLQVEKVAEVQFSDIVDFFVDENTHQVWVAGGENVGIFSPTLILSPPHMGRYRVESLASYKGAIYYSVGQQIMKSQMPPSDEMERVLDSKHTYFDCVQMEYPTLWIGGSFGAIFKYNLIEEKLTKIKDSTGRSIRHIFLDSDGNKWFSGDEKELIKIGANSSRMEFFDIESPNVVRQSPSGVLYCGAFGSENLLYICLNDRFEKLELTLDFTSVGDLYVEDLAFDESENLWLATNQGLIFKGRETNHLKRITIQDLAENEPLKAISWYNEVLWLATSNGLVAFDGEHMLTFSNQNGLPSKILKERGISKLDNQLLVATAKGIAIVNTESLKFEKTPKPLFRRISLDGNERNTPFLENQELPYRGRLEAEFVTLVYPANEISYQSRIVGLTESWSDYSTNRQVSFIGFSEGNYTLQVRARKNGCLWSDPISLDFVVVGPWYNKWWAYLIFSLLAAMILAGLIRLYYMNLIRQKKRLQNIIDARTEEVHRQKNEIIEQKNRIIRQKEELIEQNKAVFKSQKALSEADLNYLHLKEKQLEEQIEYRNKQITTHALNIIQKNEMLKDLRKHLEKVMKSSDGPAKVEIRKIVKLIDESFKLDKDWDDFRLYFEQVYTGFYTKLKVNCPSLSNQELRHCSLIRLNLSLPECASILGISPESVKVSRARIRKKLELEHYQNLTDFILSI